MDFIYMESESSGEEYEPPPDIEFSPEHTESEIEEENPIEEADNDDESENSNSRPWWTDRVPMVTDAAENIDVTEIYDVSAVTRQAHSSAAAPLTTVEPKPDEAATNDIPVKSSQRKSNGADASVDDDGQTCTICFEQWTNTSEHRLISLRCGHLFGRSCITRWLKGQNARCPQCNARARKSEIRNIYAKTVKAIDSTERDQALLDLQKESERRRKAEMETAQEKLKYVMKAQECEQLKKQLMDAHQLLQEYRLNKKHEKKPVSHKPASSFNFEKCVEINKSGTCRIMDVSDMLNMILVSQQSPSQMFPGFGIRKLSTSDFKPSEFILIHTKVIKDLSFHPRDALVLTASLDRSVKITNVLTNSNVQTYQLDCDAWSCAWDTDNPLYFYAGTKMSNVFLYDIRVTSRHVQELPRFGFHTPVISLQYISQSSNPSQNMSGPLVGKLSDCGFLKKTTDGGVHNSHPFLTVGPLASLSSIKSTGHFLISCRPSNNQPRLTHTLCELVTSPHETIVQYNPIQVVSGGRNQIQLTRSKLLNHPSDPSSLLICAGDEDAGGALIWDGSSGQFLECLKSDSCVLDFQEIQVNDKSLLMSLTDSSLRLYSWSEK